MGRRFRSDDDIDGERFRFRSGAIGWGYFPVTGFGRRRLLFMGTLGRAILAAWTDARRRA